VDQLCNSRTKFLQVQPPDGVSKFGPHITNRASCLPSEVHVSLEQEWAVVRGVGREGLEVACTLITPRIAMARQTDVLQLQVVDCLTKALEVPPVNAIVVLVDLV
jgi:hypothetical protein